MTLGDRILLRERHWMRTGPDTCTDGAPATARGSAPSARRRSGRGRRRGALLVAVAWSMLSLGGCGRILAPREPADLVPARTVVVLLADWPAVSADEGLRLLASADSLEAELLRLGIDAGDIRTFVAFEGGTDAGGRIHGQIVAGPEVDAVLDHLTSLGWEYENTPEGTIVVSPQDGSCAASAGRDVLVIGTRAGVGAALRARSSRDERFWANPVAARLREMTGREAPPLRALAVLPQGLQDAETTALETFSAVLDLSGIGAIGKLLGKIGVARGLGMTYSAADGTYPARLIAVLKDERAATLVAGGLGLFKGLASLVPAGPYDPEFGQNGDSLRSMSIDRDAEVVTVGFVVPAASLPARRPSPDRNGR